MIQAEPDSAPEYVVSIEDPVVRSLIPTYLKRRRDDLKAISQALAREDADALSVIGHNLRGSGAAYGLVRISEIGTAIEESARRGEFASLRPLQQALEAYLDNVVIE